MASSSNWVDAISNDSDKIQSNAIDAAVNQTSDSSNEHDQRNIVNDAVNQTPDSSNEHDQRNIVEEAAKQTPDPSKETDQINAADAAANQTPDSSKKNDQSNAVKEAANKATDSSKKHDHSNTTKKAANKTTDLSKKTNGDKIYHDPKVPMQDKDTNKNEKENISKTNSPNEVISNMDRVNPQLGSAMGTNFKMHLFMLRYAKSGETLKVEGYFGDRKCLFAQTMLLTSIDNNKLHMFSLELDLTRNHSADSLKISTNKPNGIKQIIRMIGLVPINKQYFGLPDTSTENFTNVIMNELTKHLKDVISSLAEDEQNSFRDGMATLICIQLLSQTFKKSNPNPLELFLNASIQAERLEIVKRVLNFIKNIKGDKNIPESIWFELLVLDSSDNLIQTIPMEIISFEVYLRCATKVVPALAQFDNFINRLSSHFDDAVIQSQFSIDLKNITFLLNFLQNKSSDDANPDLKMIRSIIDSSIPLRNNIKEYMWKLSVTVGDFSSIREIFILSIESSILFHVKRKEFLLKLLTNGNNLRSVDFYKQWFLAFMAPDKNKRSMFDDDEFKELLKIWTTCFAQRPDSIVTIIKGINVLISAISDHSCSQHFIEHMVDLCFQQKSIIEKIEQSVLLVQSPKFLNEFKLKYKTNVLNAYQNSLKELTNQINPLRILIRIDVETKYQNAFLHELIEMTCEDIKIDDEEILQDLFYKPDNQSFTYNVLFHSSFKTIHIRQYIVDRLLTQSISWEDIGMRWDELLAWKNYTNQQRGVADKVWALIREVSSKQFEIDKLINTENDKMQKTLKIIEIIPSCLDIYCSNATDKQHYKDLLQNIANSFTDKIVRTVVIPNEIEQFVPIAKRLHPYSKSTVWHLFRQQPLTLLPPATDTNVDETPNLTTCYWFLTQADKTFDLFTARLNDICTNWKTLSVSSWIHLFPDERYIDYDLRILEPLLDAVVTPILKQILDFWTGRENLICICQGIVSLLTYLKVPIDDETHLLFDSIEQLDKTKTGDDFYNVCENFSKNYSNKYLPQVLNIIGQYKTSDELITFLHNLAATDADNLLEAVNDWDETLISTKTVLDLVLIKTFLDRVYTKINLLRKQQPIQDEIHRIILCFEEVQKDDEFKSIIQCFESCSKLLSSIKRVYMDLTNKEQSKRRRIFDIVQKVCFGFVRLPVNTHGRIEHRFDVFIKEQAMYYADLNELCDRARLIEYSSNSTSKMKKDSEHEIRELRLFVGMVAVIEAILTNLTSLNMTGHPFVLDFLLPKTEFTCIAGNYQKLSEFSSSLEELLTDWEKNLRSMYQQNIDLTYFSNQQIWTVEDYLYNQASASDDNPGYHLLNFIDIEPRQIETKFLTKRSEQPNERLKNIARILAVQRAKQTKPIEVNNLPLNKILVVETSYEGILRGILSLFQFTKDQPQVHHIFYCSDTTSWTEMRAFAYRCFYSQGVLHQLIRPELLSALVQDQFTRCLHKLVKEQPKRLFRLGIVTTASTAHLQLVNGLKALQIASTIQDQYLLDKIALQEVIKELIKGNSTLVTSHIAGLGKSTYIRDEIQRNRKLYIKFSISGSINVDTLAERLRTLGKKMTSADVALHIDIGVVDNIQQLNELLYCLLLFRSFRLGQEAAYIPANIPIYIELDSSPHSLTAHAKIIVLQFLPCHHIETMNLDQLKVANMASIQLVANYLQAIDDRTIITQTIGKNNITQLDAKKCIALLQKHFLKEKNKDYVTWTQLSIFISVYESLFDGFSLCGHFIVEMMKEVNNTQLRINILQTLLQSSDQFTSLSVESVRKNQRSTNEDQVAFSDAIVRWDKSEPFTVVFSDSHDPLFVYKTVDSVSQSLKNEFNIFNQVLAQNRLPQQNLLPDYNKLTHAEFFLKLTSLSKKYYRKSICPSCFTQFENNISNCTNCPTSDVLCNPRNAKSEDVDKIIQRMGEKIQSEYVLTADNYIKMLLVYLRVQSNIPVLIMGETGCGKTALIQFLCQQILDDELAIFRIHAGISSEKIIETMNSFIAKANECSKMNSNKRLWVFLDEFNTTPSIGLFKEITCERTLLGEPLPKNLVILGACNPQRHKNPKATFDDDIGIKKDRYETQRLAHIVGSMSLLYTVVSIPETMLEYVWDYGYLDPETETKYVRTMLNSCEKLNSDSSWFEKTTVLIKISQQFFREYEDVSSVSLRDAARFCRLYNWFLKSICIREGDVQLSTDLTNVLNRATLVALSLCYFFRLNGQTERESYTNAVQQVLTSDNKYAGKPLVETLRSEQEKLVNLMELPTGTATNRALTDNIFVLIACIINRIPVILCGKPGCSKTSSVQIVISNLKGKKSKNVYFQTLPELVPVSYQGSQNCTSDSIVKVFERADKYLKAKNKTELLSVIVFDEIGLAELSAHNPLKVLHSELEVETCRHGFVGLSNWRLDASKMNRALYLACPDPDVNDLQLTAKTILKSMTSTH
ncbi:unnamed protein product, partial [Rotaria magnacalcarata]